MFEWLFPSNKKISKEYKVYLHNFDMSVWNYLGKTDITMIHTDNEKTKRSLFFFAKKNDINVRDYFIDDDYGIFKHHQYITSGVALWKALQKPYYQLIHEPSDFLRDHMLEKYQCKWSEEKQWWVSNEQAKYEHAIANQKSKEVKSIEHTENENVITLSFNTKKETK